jgi:hypothetical protein
MPLSFQGLERFDNIKAKARRKLIAIAHRVADPICRRTDQSPYIQDAEMAEEILFPLGKR